MKTRPIILLVLATLTLNSFAEEPKSAAQSQEEFLSWKLGLFLHFNVATFTERDWANGYEAPATFAPDKLDCGQWADAACAAGMKYAVLTVKHTGGWCLWDSQYTTHDITAFTNYKQGKGDIVREFVDAFRTRGLKVGFYYCFPGDFDNRNGNVLPEGKPSLHGLPPEAAGDYAGFIKKQLTELLTNYGPDLMWIDQFRNKYTRKDWPEIKAHIKAIRPNCLVIANNSLDFKQTDIHSYEYPWMKISRPGKELPPEGNTQAAEVADVIVSTGDWFWKTTHNQTSLRGAAEIAGLAKLCNSRRANYLLNVPPDNTGRLPEISIARLKEAGKLFERRDVRPKQAIDLPPGSLRVAQAVEGSAIAAAPATTHAAIEADWLRQDDVRELPAVARGPVAPGEDAVGGCDGVRTGSYGFHTARQDQPWWQVDLGRLWPLDQVLIYNRSDSAAERAAHLRVLLSDDGRSWRQFYEHDGQIFFGYRDARPLSVKLEGQRARYLRLQLPERDTVLHLDEVEVYPTTSHRNVALRHPATQSSVSPWSRRKDPVVELPGLYDVDSVVERGRRLAEDLRARGLDVAKDAGRLQAIQREADALQPAAARRRELYLQARWIVRRLALANPLLDFDQILLVKRVTARFKVSPKSGPYTHMSDQYYGWFAQPGGGLYVLEKFKTGEPRLRCLTEGLPRGNIVRPELSYDAQRVLFAFARYHPGVAELENKLDKSQIPEDAFYQLYEMQIDGSGLRRLTHGKYDHFDGCYLPDGRIVLLSTRRSSFVQCGRDATPCDAGGPLADAYVRCGGDAYRPVAVYTLHVMDADGANLHAISPFEMFEWEPSIDHQGRILYTRWDYVDREAMPYMSLWTTLPDGTGTRAVFGNYTLDPHCMFEPRAVPGSEKIVFTASAHHANTAGSLVLLDPSKGVDGPGPMTRLTPEVPFPEIEAWPSTYYASPYPLSEDYYLVGWSDQPLRSKGEPLGTGQLGVYLFDRFGNLELLYRDPAISSMYPLPVRPRQCPPCVSLRADTDASQEGTVLLTDVYRGLGSVDDGAVRRLRIVGITPKDTPEQNKPNLGLTGHDPGKFVLGTVPVESDGSAYFRMPSGVSFFVQAVGADGIAVQTMRSAIYVQPGERMTCIGCHESRQTSPRSQPPLAARREPSRIAAGPPGSWPLDYQTLVQPLVERQCVECHKPGSEGASFDLTAENSYQSLTGYGSPSLKTHVVTHHRMGRSAAWAGAAATSPLVKLLRQDHYGVNLSAGDWNRLLTWIDTYGYRIGSFSPAQEEQLRQLRRRAAPLLVETASLPAR